MNIDEANALKDNAILKAKKLRIWDIGQAAAHQLGEPQYIEYEYRGMRFISKEKNVRITAFRNGLIIFINNVVAFDAQMRDDLQIKTFKEGSWVEYLISVTDKFYIQKQQEHEVENIIYNFSPLEENRDIK